MRSRHVQIEEHGIDRLDLEKLEGSYCQKLWIWRDRATKAIDGIKGESVSSG